MSDSPGERDPAGEGIPRDDETGPTPDDARGPAWPGPPPPIPEVLREPNSKSPESHRRRPGFKARTAHLFGLETDASEFRALGVGFELAAMFAAGLILGWGFDYLFGTGPKGVYIGGAIGMVTGLHQAIKDGLRLSKSMERKERARRARGHDPKRGD